MCGRRESKKQEMEKKDIETGNKGTSGARKEEAQRNEEIKERTTHINDDDDHTDDHTDNDNYDDDNSGRTRTISRTGEQQQLIQEGRQRHDILNK